MSIELDFNAVSPTQQIVNRFLGFRLTRCRQQLFESIVCLVHVQASGGKGGTMRMALPDVAAWLRVASSLIHCRHRHVASLRISVTVSNPFRAGAGCRRFDPAAFPRGAGDSVIILPIASARSLVAAAQSARAAWMRQTIAAPERQVLLAAAEGRLGGFAICAPEQGLMQALYVDPPAPAWVWASACWARRKSDAAGRLCSRHAQGIAERIGFYQAMGYRLGVAARPLADGVEMDCREMDKAL